MKRKKQRALAAAISACLAVSMIPTQVLALETPNVVKSEDLLVKNKKETRTTYRLADGWSIMGEDASKWRANGKDSVSIDVQYGDLYYTGSAVRNTAKNVFLHPVENVDFTISAKLDFKPNQDFQSAGLIIYRDEDANFAATRRYHSYFGNKALCIQGVDGKKFTEGDMPDPSQEQAPLFLQVVKKGTTVTSYYRLSEEEAWTEYDSREWSSFEGAKGSDLSVGFYTGNSKSNGSTATFSDFTIQYEGEAAEKVDIFEESDEPEIQTEYVSDWNWSSAVVGYGQPRKDCGVDGTNDKIVLGGKTYAKGLAMHADSEVVYDIEGKGVQRFQAVAGVNRAAGSCQFIVEIDGKEVIKTGIIKGNQNTEFIDVEIPADAKMLTLKTNVGGDNGNSDHSVWADAKFVMDPSVNREDLRKITVKGTSYLPVGGEDEIHVVGELVNGSAADLTDAEITYESSDEAVLSIDENGLMTGEADGKATVTVSVTVGEVTRTDILEVIVGEGEGQMWSIKSPDESLQAMFLLDEEGVGRYLVLEDDKVVVENSSLGLVTDIADFTSGLSFEGQSEIVELVDEYELYGAKVSEVKAVANEMTLSFEKDSVGLDVVARMYDDGLAFRYVIDGEGALSVSSEETTVTIPDDSTVHALTYHPQHEGYPVKLTLEQLTANNYDSPMLYQTPNGTWGLIGEAAISGSNYCVSRFSGDGKGNVKYVNENNGKPVAVQMPFQSPWRFVVAGDAATINMNTMTENLSSECEGDFSWVKPGVTSWTWLNGDACNDLDTYKDYVDLSVEMGWQYLLMDEGWQLGGVQGQSGQSGWYGYGEWFDELAAYAKEKGIGLLAWAHNKDLQDKYTVTDDHSSELCQMLDEWKSKGIVGIKPDFFYAGTQETIAWMDTLIQETAHHQMLLDMHGCAQTAGERRTYPHLLSREAVFGGEQVHWDNSHLTAYNNCMLPFTRNAVGPMDYTPMFKRRFTGHGRNWDHNFSLGQMAAMPVVFETGIQCLADKPASYLGSPAELYFEEIPAEWENSKVLEADPGSYVTIARKAKTGDWYVGAMCDAQRSAEIDMSFLDENHTYYAIICKDETMDTITNEYQKVTSDTKISIPMLETGGAAIRIMYDKPSQPESITLDKSELTLEQYETAELNVTITPEDAEMSQVNWSSSDENVVTVKNGQLTAMNPGHAVITASTGFAGEMTAKCEVEVRTPKYSLADAWKITNMSPGYWELNDENSVTIETQIGEIYTDKVTVNNMFLTPVESAEDFTATVKLDFAPNANYQTAGLILFQDIENSFTVSERFHSSFGGNILAYHGLNNGKWTENNSSSAVKLNGEEKDPVSLQITKKGNAVSAYYKWADQTEWTKICDQTYTGLTGDLKLGLYVANAGSTDAHIPATFRDFTVQYGDGEVQEIPFAVKNEIEEETDKTNLQALISYAQAAKKNPNYEYVVPVVKELFEKALEAAVSVNENSSATQDEVDTAYETLLARVHLLDFTGNTENLQVLVDAADGKVESMYTTESWKPFAVALEAAKKVLADENALQKEIDAARDALQAAMEALVKKETADKAKLEKLVKDAEEYEGKLGEYIPSTTEGFVAALKGARDILANDAATQAEVDVAYNTLLQAIFGLREQPSKEKLEELLNKVEKMDLAQYSAKTAKAVQAAYDAALIVMKDENAEQKEVDAAVKSLEKAIAVAKAEADANDKNGATSGDGAKTEADSKDSAKKSAKTGDAANAAVPMMAGFAAIFAVLVAKKRK